ncbi:MAG: putative multidrug resistance ABC transporter ATP-binding/permease protein YheI [Candidatus Moanabacter tarae]|uniref:Putative multidrug resistance ABC transporter ATP-binding/permease protein YheI n=1 Tax=Candidatus Moanibacter tarae TaxID=2200854 RepID=A0A2Z4AI80_9BACT|nr:MAG: putative multidrug resistance ABC transporter ATP-binding/permease protein YheI [Candidatus Moanabacter tarae]
MRKVTWRLIKFRPLLFLATIFFRGIDDIAPFFAGLVLKAFFDVLTGQAESGFTAATFVALFIVVEVGDRIALFGSALTWPRWWFSIETLLRRNLLSAILEVRDSLRISGASGEVTNRLRDDVNGIIHYLNQYIHLWGNLVFAVLAIRYMAAIDLGVTLITLVPAICVVIIVDACRKLIHKYRIAQRVATERATNFINEMFKSVLAVKVGTAEVDLVKHFRGLNDQRRRSTLVDNIFNELLQSINANLGHIATGVILILVAEKMKSGSFTVGDMALFATYIGQVARSGSLLGTLLAQHKRAGVSYDRIANTVEDIPRQRLIDDAPLYLTEHPPEPNQTHLNNPLEELSLEGIGYTYPESDMGISDVSFRVPVGSFTVITGQIGSGKTTLLRSILGTLPINKGLIKWNGNKIKDPKTFLTPPRCAYTSQIPNLFSESLRENILCGLPNDPDDLSRALYQGVLDEEVFSLSDGLNTIVGPRGVKLSGGQIQRVGAARMFVRDAELFVFDDLSSALDVETERVLWTRLFKGRKATYIVVSHRRPALLRADQIVVMKDGKVDSIGTPEELLKSSREMKKLWELQGG